MRRQKLLEVEVRHDDALLGGKESLQLLVQDDLAPVLGVLEAVGRDVGIDKLRHLGTRDEFSLGNAEERAKFGRNLLLSVEPIVGGPGLSLFAVGIILGVLDLSDKLGEVLDVGAERGDFGGDSLEGGHYISTLPPNL